MHNKCMGLYGNLALRPKMSQEISQITCNDPRLLIFHVHRSISSFNGSTGRNILTFCIDRQNCQTHVLNATRCNLVPRGPFGHALEIGTPGQV